MQQPQQDDDSAKATEAIREELAVYSKLEELKNSPQFEEYTKYLMTKATSTMVANYLGDKMPSYEEFADNWSKVRGILLVLQEVGGSDRIKEVLLDQLKLYTTPQQ